MNKLILILVVFIGATAIYASGITGKSLNGLNEKSQYCIVPGTEVKAQKIDQGVFVPLATVNASTLRSIESIRSDIRTYYKGVALENAEINGQKGFTLTSGNPKLVKHLQETQGRLLQYVILHRNIFEQNKHMDKIAQ